MHTDGLWLTNSIYFSVVFRVVPGAVGSASFRNLLEMQMLRSHTRSMQSETLGEDPAV